ncbi:MAG: hypothetical protein FK731_15415 [Asgard group archaeon]|nr:hypothetical protein [Asgard group archaeon]
MKKSKIFAAVLLLAMFSSLFTVVNSGQLGITVTGETSPVDDVAPTFTPNVQYLGANDTYIQAVTGMTQDGDLSDWSGYAHDFINGVDLYLGYDATHVWIAAQWADATYDWNTTNFVNKTATNTYAIVDGADDMLAIGFSDDTMQDIFVWTASNRTDDGYAYECNATWIPDGGNLPHVMNWNGTHPLYDAYLSSIGDYGAIAVGTMYSMWFADPTASSSQNDVSVDWDWNKTKEGYYTVEMSRLLDTTHADDIDLDFTGDLSDLSIWVGKENKQDCHDMEVGITEYNMWDNNDAAYLQFSVTQAIWDETCVISGNASDDFSGLELQVTITDWGSSYDTISIDPLTGEWIYFFGYNPDDMPIGEQTITVTLLPKYEAPIVLTRDTEFVDDEAPMIVGVVDIADRYADQGGVPNDTLAVDITIGVQDNYWPNDDLLCELYYFKDEGVPLMIPMTQVSIGGPTFSCVLPLTYDPAAVNNYTYFISVWDGQMNKVDTEKHYFQVIYIPPAVTTPGFGILIGLFGLAGAAFILYKKYKK